MLGACNDDSCERLHLSSFIPSGESLKYLHERLQAICRSTAMRRTCADLDALLPPAEDVIGFVKDVYGTPAGPALSQARAEVYQQGLKLVIDRHLPTSTSTSFAGVKHSKDKNSIQVLLRDAKMYYDSESAYLAGTSLLFLVA